jgi:hypothetical protein
MPYSYGDLPQIPLAEWSFGDEACPFCKSPEYQWGECNYTCGDGWQEFYCDECGGQWQTVFEFEPEVVVTEIILAGSNCFATGGAQSGPS